MSNIKALDTYHTVAFSSHQMHHCAALILESPVFVKATASRCTCGPKHVKLMFQARLNRYKPTLSIGSCRMQQWNILSSQNSLSAASIAFAMAIFNSRQTISALLFALEAALPSFRQGPAATRLHE
jgi:hypothetical protein